MLDILTDLRERVLQDIEDQGARTFIKDTLLVSGAKYLNTLFTVAFTALLARFLGPSAYGTYKLTLQTADTIGFITPANTSVKRTYITKYSEYNQTGHEERIRDLVDLLVATAFVIGGVTVIANYVLSGLMADIYGDEAISLLLILASFRLFFWSLNSVPDAFLRAEKRMGTLSRFVTLTSLFSKGIPVALVLAGFGVKGAVFGAGLAGPVLALITGLFFVRRSLDILRLPRLGSIKRALRTDDDFLGYLTLGQIANSLFTSLPVLILGTQSSAAVGYFSIALFGARVPAIFGSSIASNLAPRLPATKVNNPEQFAENVRSTAIYSTAVLGVLAVLGAAFTPFVVPFVLGEEYRPVVPIALILFVRPFGQGIGSVIGPAYRALNRVKQSALVSTSFQALAVGVGFLLIPQYGATAAASVIVAGTFLPNILLWVLLVRRHVPALLSEG